MMTAEAVVASSGSDAFDSAGLHDDSAAHRNLTAPLLYEHAIRRGEGLLAASGPFVVETGEHTGRSPLDKFIVREPSTADEIWWGKVNQPVSIEEFAALERRVVEHLGGRERFIQDLYAGADPTYRLRVRVVTENAWQALFAQNLFIVPTAAERAADADREPDFTVLHAPSLSADPDAHGTRTETVIALGFERQLVQIAGTRYAGEIKKSIFTALQFLLPQRGVATLHCSANIGPANDVALFFGLSGTGKTTLSTDPSRTLIGDDEHGWSDDGIFNFEGGSYAKVIDLAATAEPDIYRASHQFGTVLENVVIDPESREIDLTDNSLTDNTRAAFPISFIDNATTRGMGPHPRHLILLSADAFGVLPPVSRLSPDQALYYFLSGYTSKLAGTERGVDEPEATFSAGFGAPFLPLPPARYAELLGERIARHQPALWLVNTGWSGGAYGSGERMPIALTRAIIAAIVDGSLARERTQTHPILGLEMPVACPAVPAEMLQPRATWSHGDAYDAAARRLAPRLCRQLRAVCRRRPGRGGRRWSAS